MSMEAARKCYQSGRVSQELPAVCSQAYHRQLAAKLWDGYIIEIGVMKDETDPHEDLVLGNCPCCNTTLSKKVVPA